jgi:hypothetical protein
MRVTLYLLVLLNLLFFGWARWIDVPPAGRTPAPLAPLELEAPASAAGPMRCTSLGPLPDTKAAAALATALRTRNLTPRERQRQVAVPDGYFVYVDHLADAAARASALKRLARGGVHDAAALAAGQVSVGLFSSEEGARQRARQVRAAGLEPVIEPRSRNVTAFWLDVRLARDQAPPAAAALGNGLDLPEEPAWGECRP